MHTYLAELLEEVSAENKNGELEGEEEKKYVLNFEREKSCQQLMMRSFDPNSAKKKFQNLDSNFAQIHFEHFSLNIKLFTRI